MKIEGGTSQETVGVLLYGGRGTRLRPLTDQTSKALLDVGGKPLGQFPLEAMRDAGLKDAIALVDARFSNQFLRAFEDGRDLGINISYVWQHEFGKGLPTAIAQVQQVSRERRIMVACGDVIIEPPLDRALDSFLDQDSGARLLGTPTSDSAGYSPLLVHQENVVRMLRKDPTRHKPAYIDLGTYFFMPDVFRRVESLTPSLRGETEIWDLLGQYIAEHNLFYTPVEGWWSDVGNHERLAEARERYA
jgi:glucose-1-phosphate thymidylyltransferase